MNWALFIIVLIVSFIVVRIGAIAFQVTGLEWSLAKFQSLSCFTGTGFTTKEAELITGNKQRRRIASVLMVLGNAGLVIMIATFANSLSPQEALESGLSKPLLPIIPPYLVRWLNLNPKLSSKLTNFLRKRIIRKEIFQKVSFEELLFMTGGYGISRVAVYAGSPVANKTLAESQLRSYDINVLAIVREGQTIPNPSAGTMMLLQDELVCFGKLENIRNKICMNP